MANVVASSLGGLFQGLSQGMALGQQHGLEAEREKRLAEIQKQQMGLNLIRGFNQLLDAPPNLSGPLWDTFIKSTGQDPKDPNVQLLGKAFGKLDPEQRATFKDYLGTIGVQEPDKVIDFVGELTRNPGTMLKLFSDVSQHQQQQTLGKILSGGFIGQPLSQGGTAPSLITEQDVTRQPQMQPQQTAAPQDVLGQAIGALEGQLQALNAQQAAIMRADISPTVKKQGLDQLNGIIDNTRQRLSQLQGRQNDLLKERREERLATQPSQEVRDLMNPDPNVQAAIQRRQQMRNENAAVYAGATARARREALQDAPLDTKATQWVKLDTLETASPDMTPKEAKEAGFSVITPSLSQAIPSARTALKVLDRYEELIKKLLVPTEGKGSGAGIAAVQQNRLSLNIKGAAGDPDVREFQALSATLPTQVKAFGDTGNIAVKETEFAGQAMANFGDSQEAGLRKNRSRRALLQQVIRSSISSASRRAEAIEKKQGSGGIEGMSNKELLDALSK